MNIASIGVFIIFMTIGAIELVAQNSTLTLVLLLLFLVIIQNQQTRNYNRYHSFARIKNIKKVDYKVIKYQYYVI